MDRDYKQKLKNLVKVEDDKTLAEIQLEDIQLAVKEAEEKLIITHQHIEELQSSLPEKVETKDFEAQVLSLNEQEERLSIMNLYIEREQEKLKKEAIHLENAKSGLQKYAEEVFARELSVKTREEAFNQLKQENPKELYNSLNTEEVGVQVSFFEDEELAKQKTSHQVLSKSVIDNMHHSWVLRSLVQEKKKNYAN